MKKVKEYQGKVLDGIERKYGRAINQAIVDTAQLFTARKRKSGSPVAEVDSFLKDLSLQPSVGEGDTFDSHQYNFLDREFERLSESQQNPPLSSVMDEKDRKASGHQKDKGPHTKKSAAGTDRESERRSPSSDSSNASDRDSAKPPRSAIITGFEPPVPPKRDSKGRKQRSPTPPP